MSFGSRSLPRPTEDEAQRMDLARSAGCILTGVPGELHHLLVGGLRVGHRFTVCLNPWLHRGVPCNGMTITQCRAAYGPSMYHQKRLFRETYGDDQTLLNKQDEMIGYPCVIIPGRRERRLK